MEETEGSECLWGTKGLGYEAASSQRGKQLLVLAQAVHRRQLWSLSVANTSQEPAPAALTSAPHHWSEGPRAERGEGRHLNRASSGPNIRVSAPATWDQAPPLIGRWWPLSREGAAFHSQLQPHPYEDDSCQYTPRKGMICTHVTSTSPTKDTGHMQSV